MIQVSINGHDYDTIGYTYDYIGDAIHESTIGICEVWYIIDNIIDSMFISYSKLPPGLDNLKEQKALYVVEIGHMSHSEDFDIGDVIYEHQENLLCRFENDFYNIIHKKDITNVSYLANNLEYIENM